MKKYTIFFLYLFVMSCYENKKNTLLYLGKWHLVTDSAIGINNKQWFVIDSFNLSYRANYNNKFFLERQFKIDDIINNSSWINKNTIVCHFVDGHEEIYIKNNKITNQSKIDSFMKISILDSNTERLLYDKKWILDSISADSFIMLNLNNSPANRIYGHYFVPNKTNIIFLFDNEKKIRTMTMSDSFSTAQYYFSINQQQLTLIDIDFLTSFKIDTVNNNSLILSSEWSNNNYIKFYFK